MNYGVSTTFVVIMVLGFFLSLSVLSVNAQDISSPRQQMASGVAVNDVVCKSGLVLMVRTTNGSAACVTSSTSMKLSETGWGTVIVNDNEKKTMEEKTMENATNEKVIELSEGLSMGDKQGMPEGTMEEESFTIGGIDLSMAAPVEGNKDAPITIIEFGDYQCPKCKDWFQNEKPAIINSYISKGIAKLYFLDSAWYGNDSISAAQAAYCADDQGKFIEYHSTLYNNQAGIQDGWANMDALKQFANDLELDTEMFNKCLDSGIYADRVSHNTEVGVSLGVVGTPYFFIVGPGGDIKKIAGPQPSMVFDAAINSLS
jgi:protein-disulfide isomerase